MRDIHIVSSEERSTENSASTSGEGVIALIMKIRTSDEEKTYKSVIKVVVPVHEN